MDTVLVTGGTGHLGRDIVSRLTSRGHRVRVLARNPRPESAPGIEWIKGDLATGAGIDRAVAGADTVVHAATHSPAAQRGRLRIGDFFGSPTDVDVDGTRQLLAASRQTGVEHFLHISIVGVQQSRLPYSRVKAAAEDWSGAGRTPWSIVAATPFYWLLARMFDHMADQRRWPLPSNLSMQPCDATDFAGYVVDCLNDGPRGVRDDFGGPQVMSHGRAGQAVPGRPRGPPADPGPAVAGLRPAGSRPADLSAGPARQDDMVAVAPRSEGS